MVKAMTKTEQSGRPNDDLASGIDLAEKGRDAEGNSISLNRRLFMQFLALGDCQDVPAVIDAISDRCPQAVLYQDLNDPRGLGLVAFSEDPEYFLGEIQPMLNSARFQSLRLKPEFTMLGRTYSIGYEADLVDVLINRPQQRVCDPATPWGVWYPVRRSGEFERQSRDDQRRMLMEHGGIGHAYGKAELATDIRLAAHGLNTDDNDFIVGLLGKDLFPLSALVQHMRRTRQTSEFIKRMGPFFVGRAVWQPQYQPGA